jgi:hypothetical protein
METTFAPVQSAMRSNSNIAESLLGPSSGGGGGGNSSSRDDDGSGRRSDTFEMTVHSNESKDDPVIGLTVLEQGVPIETCIREEFPTQAMLWGLILVITW